jgi:hypothetical protein
MASDCGSKGRADAEHGFRYQLVRIEKRIGKYTISTSEEFDIKGLQLKTMKRHESLWMMLFGWMVIFSKQDAVTTIVSNGVSGGLIRGVKAMHRFVLSLSGSFGV